MNERDGEYKHLERERMISLADLFEEILRRIWLIIVLAVVFAVLCAGYKYMQDRSKADASVNANSYEKAVSSLSEKEILEVESVLDLYDEVEAADQYMTGSIRMNIDPYHEDRVTLQYALQAEPGNAAGLAQVFETYVTGGGLGADLQETVPDVEAVYLSELVSFVEGTAGDAAEEAELEGTGRTIVAFAVRVIGADADMADELADSVEACLEDYAQKLAGQIDDFSLILVDQTAAQVYDSTLNSAQASALSDLITLQNRINTQEGYLSDAQTTVLQTMLAQDSRTVQAEADSELSGSSTATRVHISARYALLGVLIGIVLGIIVIVLFYIARGALNIAQEMPGVFGIPLLGQVHEKKQRNPLVRGWRRLVYKKKALPPETGRQIALENLKTYCQKNGVDRILVTGTRRELDGDAQLQELRNALAEAGITAAIAGGLPDSPDALGQLNDYPCVALAETLHKSHYREVVREVELCEERGMQVAGAIVLD